MSTRSNVGIKDGDKFKYIYVHFDGYPTGVGRTLRKYYRDEEKVKELLSLGDCSILGPELVKAKEHFDDLEYIDPNGSVFYGRDRGEDNVDAKEVGWEEYKDDLDDTWAEYVYVFENGQWSGFKVRYGFNEDHQIDTTKTELVLIEDKEYEDA